MEVHAIDCPAMNCAMAYKMADYEGISDSSDDEDYVPEGRVSQKYSNDTFL